MHAAAHPILILSNAENANGGVILRLSTGAATATSGVRIDANGQPVKSYTKAILRAGITLIDNAGRPFPITEKYLDGIVASFGKMKAAGVKVPMQNEHTFDGDNVRGHVNDVWREGGVLMASIDLIGEEAIKSASRADVSVFVHPALKIGGVTYPDGLLHVAITGNPQVPGLGPWAPIAASLAAQVFATPQTKGDTMNWQDTAKLLGLSTTGLDDTTGPAKVNESITALVAEKGAIQASLATATSQVGVLQASVARLSASAPKVDADILNELAGITADKLKGLVEKRVISPAQSDKLSALLCGTEGSRPVLCLSATAAKHAGLPGAIAASVIDILAMGAVGNGSANGKSKTGEQRDPNANNDGPGEDFHKAVSSYLPTSHNPNA